MKFSKILILGLCVFSMSATAFADNAPPAPPTPMVTLVTRTFVPRYVHGRDVPWVIYGANETARLNAQKDCTIKQVNAFNTFSKDPKYSAFFSATGIPVAVFNLLDNSSNELNAADKEKYAKPKAEVATTSVGQLNLRVNFVMNPGCVVASDDDILKAIKAVAQDNAELDAAVKKLAQAPNGPANAAPTADPKSDLRGFLKKAADYETAKEQKKEEAPQPNQNAGSGSGNGSASAPK